MISRRHGYWRVSSNSSCEDDERQTAPTRGEGALLVSVAIATWNGAQYLPEQLASILNQTYRPDEFVIADDASTDGTLAILQDFRRANPRLRVVILENAGAQLGATRNFQRAIDTCSGDIIVLSDQDDVCRHDRIAFLVESLNSGGHSLVASDAEIVDDRGRPVGETQFERMTVTPNEFARLNGIDALSAMLRRNILPGMTFAFRRDLLRSARPWPTSWPHDYWIAIVAAASGQLRITTEPLVRYRQHSHNTVGALPAGAGASVARIQRRFGSRELWLNRWRELRAHLESRGTEIDASALRECARFGRYIQASARSSTSSGRAFQEIGDVYREGLYSIYETHPKSAFVLDVIAGMQLKGTIL